MQLCTICNVNPATLHTPCECQVPTCEDCVPEHIPTQEELAEEYGPCTGDACSYKSCAEDARFESVMEMIAEPVTHQNIENYQNNAPWSALPDCRCVPVSACRCDSANRA